MDYNLCKHLIYFRYNKTILSQNKMIAKKINYSVIINCFSCNKNYAKRRMQSKHIFMVWARSF